jgi:hypothetical protein
LAALVIPVPSIQKHPARAILVRVGIDATYGRWNAPADPTTREFVYVPIPETRPLRQDADVGYCRVLPALQTFCLARSLDLDRGLRFPAPLRGSAMHLDPDFDHLTYGDDARRRGAQIARLGRGELLVFYAGLRSVLDRTLIYGLVGILTVGEILAAADVPGDRLHENAHTRRLNPSATEFVVRGAPGSSGRLARYLPIGEWRAGAYRVRHDLLNAWGGLSGKDGFIQRSARPPRFLEPWRFRDWLDRQEVTLVARNNC